MEWVETTGKTIEEAQELALDRLGVAEDDAEIEVLEAPRAGLFGLIRGEARIRARVRPAELRPKADRRRGRKSGGRDNDAAATATSQEPPSDADAGEGAPEPTDTDTEPRPASGRGGRGRSSGRDGDGRSRNGDGDRGGRGRGREDRSENDGEADVDVDPAAVGAAAVTFMEGLLEAFGLEGTVELLSDGVDLEVRVAGDELGLLIGPGGRTLTAIQDLVRVAAQRRLGDHETRLRVDVSGYRERRKEALERFTRTVADQVIDSGMPKSLEPMPSADRKIVHDVLNEIEGVQSRSEGDDPYRRVVVEPS